MSERIYASAIRGPVRTLWNGVISYEQFWESMLDIIRLGLTDAWHEGLKTCDLFPEDQTADERLDLELRIVKENNHIGGFATFIEDNSRANGGLLRDVFSRAEMWINRYKDVVNQAKITACKDKKLKWTWNPRKEHCSTCGRLHKRVYRASVWEKNGVQPQNPPNSKLECEGWRCGCELDPTTDRITPGPFPSLP